MFRSTLSCQIYRLSLDLRQIPETLQFWRVQYAYFTEVLTKKSIHLFSFLLSCAYLFPSLKCWREAFESLFSCLCNLKWPAPKTQEVFVLPKSI